MKKINGINLGIFTAITCLSVQAFSQKLHMTTSLQPVDQIIKQGNFESTTSLTEVYESALQKNLAYSINDRQYQQVLTRIDQAKSYGRPQVTANAGVAYQNSFGQYSSGSVNGSVGIRASQVLYSKELNLNVNIAELDAQMAERQLALAQQELMSVVAQSYLNLILKEDFVKLSGDKVDTLKNLAAYTQARVQQGRLTKDQLSYVLADQKRAQLRLAEATQQREYALLKFQNEFGIIFKGNLSARNVTIPRIDNKSTAEWIQEAEKNSLKVQIQQAALEIASKDIAKARSLSGPVVTLEAGASKSRTSNNNDFRNQFDNGSYIGVFVNIPLYDGGLRSATQQESVLKKDTAELEKESTRRQAHFDAESAINEYSLAVNGINNQREIISLTEDVVKSTQAAFETGNADFTLLLLETNKLFDSKYELAQINVKALTSYIDLKLSTGSLRTEDLSVISKTLSRKSLK